MERPTSGPNSSSTNKRPTLPCIRGTSRNASLYFARIPPYGKGMLGLFPRFGLSGTSLAPLLLPYGTVHREVRAGYFKALEKSQEEDLHITNRTASPSSLPTLRDLLMPTSGILRPADELLELFTLFRHPYWDYLPARRNPMLRHSNGALQNSSVGRPTGDGGSVPPVDEGVSSLPRAGQHPNIPDQKIPSDQNINHNADERAELHPDGINQQRPSEQNIIRIDETTSVVAADDDPPGSFPTTAYRFFLRIIDANQHCSFCQRELSRGPVKALECDHSVHSACLSSEDFMINEVCYFCVNGLRSSRLIFARKV